MRFLCQGRTCFLIPRAGCGQQTRGKEEAWRLSGVGWQNRAGLAGDREAAEMPVIEGGDIGVFEAFCKGDQGGIADPRPQTLLMAQDAQGALERLWPPANLISPPLEVRPNLL